MPTTLNVQSARVLGLETLGAADGTGNTVPNAPGSYLVVAKSTTGTARIRIVSAAACSFGRLTHYVEETVSLNERIAIPLHDTQVDETIRRRIGDAVQVTYPDGIVGVTVGAVRLLGFRGEGGDDETPPALGSVPGAVATTGKDDEPTFAAAAVDGMLLEGNDGRVQLWIANSGPATRTVFLHASRNCSYGFRDDEVLQVAVGSTVVTRNMPIARFGQRVAITYDTAAGLSFAAVQQEDFVS